MSFLPSSQEIWPWVVTVCPTDDIWPGINTADDLLRCSETLRRPVESPQPGNNW